MNDIVLDIKEGVGAGGRAVQGVGLWPLAWWDCGFESRREHKCLSVVSIVCCQVEVWADPSSREVQPFVVCLSATVKPQQWGGLSPSTAFAPQGKQLRKAWECGVD
jgi:hypothetical protein